jgi:hypothetical protein
MQDISDDQRNLAGDDWNLLDVIRYIASLRILLFPDGAWIGFPEGIHDNFQIVDVLFGPITLR